MKDESKRISESRGRVRACPDEPGTYRVWMPKGETQQGPGLALSRDFGDYFIKDFGLISEPEVTQRKITTMDQFAILATDGVRMYKNTALRLCLVKLAENLLVVC